MASPVSVRLPVDVRQDVAHVADLEQRTFSNMVTVLVIEALRARNHLGVSEKAGGVGDLAVTGDAPPRIASDPVRAPADSSTKKTFRPDPKGR